MTDVFQILAHYYYKLFKGYDRYLRNIHNSINKKCERLFFKVTIFLKSLRVLKQTHKKNMQKTKYMSTVY